MNPLAAMFVIAVVLLACLLIGFAVHFWSNGHIKMDTAKAFFIQGAYADKPYYSTGDHTIRVVVKFTNDNWHEIYARATPKNNNHVLLNYQYVDNNDSPDCGPSETIYLYLPFKDAKMVQTKATNEGKIRTYVTLELVDGSTGETVTKYIPYDKTQRIQNFGTYLMHPPGC